MRTLLIAHSDQNLRSQLAARIRDSRIRAEQILEFDQEGPVLDYLKEHGADVLLADVQMRSLWTAGREEEFPHSLLPFVVLIGSGGDFSSAVEMMRLGVRDWLSLPIAPGLLEERLQAMEQELAVQERFYESGKRTFCAHIRYLLLHPESFEKDLLADLDFFFCQVMKIRGPYRLVIACRESGAFPMHPEIVLQNMEGGSCWLITREKAEKLMEILENGGCLGISREHSTIFELQDAYREAAAARKVSFVCCRPWEEYHDYSFPETDALNVWKEKYLYEFSMDRLEMLEKKPHQWFFEARHLHVSPFQLLRVMEELCAELNEYYDETEEAVLEIPRCPMPLESPDADIFLEKFEKWTETCRDHFFKQNVSPQNVKKIRKAMDYIRENFRKDLSMAAVSNYVSMNYSLFSNEFKKYCGINFVNYLKEIRIREARRLLEETDWKISEIGIAVGYENDKHFMKTFRSSCGQSPTEYRRSMEARRKKERLDESRKK